MTDTFDPAITALERRLQDYERKANEIKRTINVLCEEAGKPPRYPDDPGDSGGSTVTQIRDDTFYGKKQQTAVREYLEMRKVQDLGPAKPREIYDALVSGGFQFEAKEENVRLIGLRAMLRKRTNMFHRLPTGSYGLLSWYSDIKSPKAASTADEDDDDDDDKTVTTESTADSLGKETASEKEAETNDEAESETAEAEDDARTSAA